jgi:hypothetical protein
MRKKTFFMIIVLKTLFFSNFFTFIVVTLCVCSQILWYPTKLNNFMACKIHQIFGKFSSNHITILGVPSFET